MAAQPRAIATHLPLVLLLPLRLVGIVLLIVGVLLVLVTRLGPVVAAWHAGRVEPAGRVALAVVVLVALPGFLSALVDILG